MDVLGQKGGRTMTETVTEGRDEFEALHELQSSSSTTMANEPK